MKRILAILVTLCGFLTVSAQTSYDLYIVQYYEIAVSEMYRSGVPASITLAQGLLESSAGQSVLARMGNNHFGIKCAGTWTGQTIYHDDDAKGECFRKYSSAKDSFRDHSDFLRYSKRYQSLFDLKITDYKGWANGLKAAGYATDPGYAKKLISIIEQYDLNDFDVNGRSARQSRDERERGDRKHEEGSIRDWTPVSEAEEEVIPDSPTKLQQANRSGFSFSISRPVYELNGVPFIYVMEGETLDSIARDYQLFRKELLKFNDLKEGAEIHPGQVIYLKAKNNKAIKGLDKHVVEYDSETMWEISQHYAIKLKSLEKMNNMLTTGTLREGVILNLR